MRNRALGLAVSALLAGLICSIAGLAQDYHRTFTLPPNGHISIRNISGDVSIQGYDGSTVTVEGIRVGRDLDKVEIVDASSENRIDLDVRYPENCNCSASVNFEVRVPRGLSYNFDTVRSVSGNVLLQNVRGQVRADSTSGDVQVTDVTGSVSANSVSGDVEVTLVKIEGTANMKFSSISGDVNVKAPATLDASISMSTLSGSLRTDFPIEVLERRYGPGRSARGQVGNGTNSIRITSVSGRVTLTRY